MDFAEGLLRSTKNQAHVAQANNKLNKNDIIPRDFVLKGTKHRYNDRDAIFSVSQPVSHKAETASCVACKEPFNKPSDRCWCNFCGQNMCQKCSREKQLPNQAERWPIDLLCLKKFHIRQMCAMTEKTCQKLAKNIEAKKTELHSLDKKQQDKDPELKKQHEELLLHQDQLEVLKKHIKRIQLEVKQKKDQILLLHRAGNIKRENIAKLNEQLDKGKTLYEQICNLRDQHQSQIDSMNLMVEERKEAKTGNAFGNFLQKASKLTIQKSENAGPQIQETEADEEQKTVEFGGHRRGSTISTSDALHLFPVPISPPDPSEASSSCSIFSSWFRC